MNFFWETLQHIANPRCGNIHRSPKPRVTTPKKQVIDDWIDFTDQFNDFKGHPEEFHLYLRSCIGRAIDELDKFWKRSHRDEVIIQYDLRYVVRDIIAKFSVKFSRRIIKVLDLKLCESDLLLECQKRLLNSEFANSIIEEFDPKKSKLEYLQYYFPAQKNSFTKYYLLALRDALDNNHKKAKNFLTKEGLGNWYKLPPIIRGAILLNDFRKITRSSETQLRFYGDKINVYASKPHVIQSHLPGNPFLMWSWSRDRTFEGRQEHYMRSLLPTHGGLSGHVNGIIQFWYKANIVVLVELIVASSMFTLWRLYYDKRISPVHTMAETFDATYISVFLQKGAKFVEINQQLRGELKESGTLPVFDFNRDAFEGILNLTSGQPYLNPLVLLDSCVKSFVPEEQSRANYIDNMLKSKKLTPNIRNTIFRYLGGPEPRRMLQGEHSKPGAEHHAENCL